MLQVSNVQMSFGDNRVLRGVSFDLQSGEFVGMIGPSGGGKSVLLKLLSRVMPADGGEITFQGQPIAKSAARIGFLFQEGALFDSMSVLENVAFPLSVGAGALPFAERSERAYEMLTQVGLGEARHKYPGQLSGGMRRRVGIARALVGEPNLLLLDDPTGGLDPVAASIIVELIQRLHQQYRPTVLLVSHDLRRLLPNVDRVLGLFHGEIELDCTPRELLSQASPEVLDFVRTRFDFNIFTSARNTPTNDARP